MKKPEHSIFGVLRVFFWGACSLPAQGYFWSGCTAPPAQRVPSSAPSGLPDGRVAPCTCFGCSWELLRMLPLRPLLAERRRNRWYRVRFGAWAA